MSPTIERGPGHDWRVRYRYEDEEIEELLVFGQIKIEDALAENVGPSFRHIARRVAWKDFAIRPNGLVDAVREVRRDLDAIVDEEAKRDREAEAGV